MKDKSGCVQNSQHKNQPPSYPHRKPLPSLGATAALRQAQISHASTLVCLNSVWLYTCSRSDPDIPSALS